jgi:murein DD-endopeptidase MepM/ murein hydrolase activator NlpD
LKDDPLPLISSDNQSDKIKFQKKSGLNQRAFFGLQKPSQYFVGVFDRTYKKVSSLPGLWGLIWRTARTIRIQPIQRSINRAFSAVLSSRYLQHAVVFLILVLVIINNVSASETDSLGQIDQGFESQADAKIINNEDLVSLVKVIDQYTLVSEEADVLPERLSQERSILIDRSGFIIQTAYAFDQDVSEVTAGTEPAKSKRRKTETYIIQGGDTLSLIAERYGISVTTLKFANNLSDIDTILPGDKLVVPSANGVLHKVKAGETLLGIVNKYRGDFEKTLKENSLDEKSFIFAGQDILVVGGRYVAPTPRLPTRSTNTSSFAGSSGTYSGPIGNFVFPTSSGTYYNGYHWWAIDIPRPTGTSVRASDGGRVVNAGWNSGGYGNYIVIDHGNGYKTLYGHLSSISVSSGQYVNQGQYIGGIGSTGRSTGSHLHFEIIRNGQKQNPIQYF